MEHPRQGNSWVERSRALQPSPVQLCLTWKCSEPPDANNTMSCLIFMPAHVALGPREAALILGLQVTNESRVSFRLINISHLEKWQASHFYNFWLLQRALIWVIHILFCKPMIANSFHFQILIVLPIQPPTPLYWADPGDDQQGHLREMTVLPLGVWLCPLFMKYSVTEEIRSVLVFSCCGKTPKLKKLIEKSV